MKKNSISFIFFFAIILSIVSCQKNVNVSEIFPDTGITTSGTLIAQFAGLYSPLASNEMYAQGFFGFINGGADECFNSSSNTSSVSAEYYNTNSKDVKIYNLWAYLYRGIERANIILSVVNQPADLDSVTRRDYIGQAKFLRAYYFYQLVNLYGDVPLKTQLSTSMGSDFQLPRTPSKQVYDYIISEMTAADSLIKPMSAVNSTLRVTQSAVEAILARVCLSATGNPVNDTKRYNDALYWSRKLINANIHGLYATPHPLYPTTPSYARVFINNMQDNFSENNTLEDIWDVSFLSKSNFNQIASVVNYSSIQTLGANMGIYNPIVATLGYCSGAYRAFPKLFNLYGTGDLRRDWAISPYSYKDSTPTKYPYLSVNFTGGGGTGAAATAYTNNLGKITSIVIDNPGSGYTTAPTISFTSYKNAKGIGLGSTGSGAVVKAVITNGGVSSITISNGGTNYTTIYDHCVGKWRREYEVNLVKTQNYTSCEFPVIRYSDVLLMAAEADFMLNGVTPTAVDEINQVRRRGYGLPPNTPSTISDLTSFTLQDIMDERSRELCFEATRRSDLIRWGTISTVMQNLLTANQTNAPSAYQFTSTLAASNYVTNPTQYNLLPIPYSELGLDHLLTQNPGW